MVADELEKPVVRLPAYTTVQSILELLGCAEKLFQAIDTGVVCDGQDVKFIDPCAIAVLSCIADHYKRSGASVQLIGFSKNILSYLLRMDAFEGFIDQKFKRGVRHDRADSLLEVTQISKDERTDAASERLVSSLLGAMTDLPEDEESDGMTYRTQRSSLEEPLEYIFTELLDNVFQHGRRNSSDVSAWVCSQYYKSNDYVRFAIVDNGCGILHSLSEHPDLIEKTDAAAIQLALRERTSGNPTLLLMGSDHSANQGVGLTVVLKMVEMAGGKMWIASGCSALRLDGKIKKLQSTSSWQGCVLAIEIKRSSLMKVRINQAIGLLDGAKENVKLDFF